MINVRNNNFVDAEELAIQEDCMIQEAPATGENQDGEDDFVLQDNVIKRRKAVKPGKSSGFSKNEIRKNKDSKTYQKPGKNTRSSTSVPEITKVQNLSDIITKKAGRYG